MITKSQAAGFPTAGLSHSHPNTRHPKNLRKWETEIHPSTKVPPLTLVRSVPPGMVVGGSGAFTVLSR